LPGPVDRFLDHWRPDLAFFVDSEFWPGLIGGLAVRGVPLALVNGRVTEATVRQWSKASFIMRTMLDRFSVVLAQSPEDADRLIRLGARRDRV
ncbi:glycosyltransferase N-terminal domain-containing protein, partial [Salmonella enterica]|uniref:glycosyltransferase N-terminal domain-containing protein n=1 Tax=Salmonella enterica TaxID=28901 RepID=UPI003D2DC84B